jgi:hypothetical protein
MPKYTITQTVEYCAEAIEADSEEEALSLYLKDQDSYYVAVESETIEELEWCEDCNSEEVVCRCEDEEEEDDG